MTNEIDSIRTAINQNFDSNGSLGWTDVFSQSEYGLFYIATELYKQASPDRNWIITKVYIGHIEKEGYFFEYLTDNDDTCFEWIYKDKKDYLLLPEAQGGQSIFDIAEQKLHSFYSSEDPFIWTDIHVSADKTKLAVTGCYWACPFEIVVYDCTELTKLPYTCVYRQPLDNNFEIKEWEDNRTIVLTTKNKKTEQRVKI